MDSNPQPVEYEFLIDLPPDQGSLSFSFLFHAGAIN